MARIARADVGPLAPYADGYRELLAGLGYTPDGVVRKLWELGRVSDWMIRNELGPEDLTAVRFDEFTELCKAGVERPVGYRTLAPLVGYLRDLGAVPSEMFGATPVDELVDRYRSWMVDERALAVRTVERYEQTAQRFLTMRAAQRGGGCGAEDLAGSEVFGFLLAETERVSVGSAKGRVAEMRSLLQFLFLEGFTETSLAVSIPPVAGWRDTALPATLSRSQVESIVAAQDTSTVTGRRNYASDLCRPRAEGAEVGHVVGDLLPALREVLDGRSSDAGHVADPSAGLVPCDAEPLGEMGAQLCLVEEADGAAPRVDLATIEGGPPTFAGDEGEVGEHDVGVQVRVASARGAVPKRGGDEALGVHDREPTSAASCARCLVLEHCQGGIDCSIVRSADGVAHLW